MTSLESLLVQHEGKTLEFKRDVSSPDKLIRTIVAFANGAGGTLLVGVEDGTRQVRGVEKPTEVEEQLANLIADRIMPRLVPELQIVPWRKKYVVMVRVYPSSCRPHYVKSQGPQDGVYLRIGSTNRKADPAQIDEIERFVGGHTFDEQPLADMDTEAIDFRAASECFAPVRKLKAGDLRTLQLATRCQGREVPTAGGILLFGRERLERFPDAYIRAGSFAGTDKAAILDSLTIQTHLPLALEQAMQFVQRSTRRAIDVQGSRHVERREYPLVAVREALANAIVHADYAQRGSPISVAVFADRIEIYNPGGLLPGLTVEDIQTGVSRLRNRVIGRVFHELGLIEQWGSGIQRMTAACLAAGLASPILEEVGSGFRVTLAPAVKGLPVMDSVDRAIMDLLQHSGGMSTSEVAKGIARTSRATRDRLNHLVGLGMVVAVGSAPRDPRRVYRVVSG